MKTADPVGGPAADDDHSVSLSVPSITSDHGNLEAALAYAKAGWYVGPEKRGTKNPGSVLGDDWHRKTSRDAQMITSWFAGTNHGIFLHVGRSGAWVADVDNPENLHPAIQQAITQYKPPYQSTRPDTPGRGHFIFAVPDGRRIGNSLGELGKGWGEGRGLNGVIIVAPSEHEKPEGCYEWQRTGPVPTMPGYMASQLPDVTEASEAATDAEIAAFLAKPSEPTEPRIDLLDRHVYGYRNKVAAGESRHHEMTGPLASAMREAAAGYLDAKFAAEALQSVFLEAVARQPTSSKQGKPRTGPIAKNEWNGLLAWAVGQAQAGNPEETRARINEKFPPLYTEAAAADDEFWDNRDALKHIREFAYSRMASPWAVLGVTIIRVLHCVYPWITLPPLIGGKGSLNLFVALVANSGGGKGTAEAAADAFDLDIADIYTAPLGSGEGITHQYAHYERKEGTVRDRNEVLFTTAEIDTIAALATRQGSTLTGQLRSAYMGERLGFSYADPTRRIILEAHSYRFGLIVGVQPERAGVLINDEEGGTPQRFIWLPATDPGITADPPPTPEPMKIDATRGQWKRGHIPIPVQVAREIREAHVARHQGDGHALDGHALFSREKVAVALALLDNRRDMNLEDWRLAGIIMAKSDAVRATVITALNKKAKAAETARALNEGRREVIRSQVVAGADLERACRAITRKLRRDNGWVTGKAARDVLGSLRHYFNDAVDKLEEAGQIEVEHAEYKGRPSLKMRLSEPAK